MVTFLILLATTSLMLTAGEQQLTREIMPPVLRTFAATADQSSSSEAVRITYRVIKNQLGRLTLTSKGMKQSIESERFIDELHPSIVEALCAAKGRETLYNRQKPVIRINIRDSQMQQELMTLMNSVLNEHANWFPTVAPIIAYYAIPSQAAEQRTSPLLQDLEDKTAQTTNTMDYYYDHQDEQEYIPELAVKKMSAKGRYIAFCEVELSLKIK